jgi:hypothetical protein
MRCLAAVSSPWRGDAENITYIYGLLLLAFCRKMNESLIWLRRFSLSKSMPSPLTGGKDQGEEGHSKVLKLPVHCVLRLNSWTKSRQKSESRVFLLAIQIHLYSFALRILIFKLTQLLTVSTVQLLYTVKKEGGKPDKKNRN